MPWGSIASAAIGAGAGLIGGAADAAASAESARRANETNIRLAKENRDFQERMRATQYQTAVKDLGLAGLNPMLAYTQGGAGTPQGSVATVEPTYKGGALSSAMSALQTVIQAQRQKAEIDNIKADTDVKRAEAESASDYFISRANKEGSSAESVHRDAEKKIRERDEGVWAAEFANKKAQVGLTTATAENIRAANQAAKMFMSSDDPTMRAIGAGIQMFFK